MTEHASEAGTRLLLLEAVEHADDACFKGP